ncbi:enoyl-CoA hydratase/isomerase family protein [Pyrobaculum sp.]|uniref:enoyl-CoA hydratase/isomerase family protein n=1 Tax=Pyrobaculum sp. TaxID=2004705 RepID=UPI003164B9A0
MSDSKVLCEARDGVFWITLNRPDKLNAMDLEVRQNLLRCLQEAQSREDIRVVILRGAGKAFSAGADASHLKMLSEMTLSDFEKLPKGVGIADIGVYIREMSKPVIAMVHGYVVGGGMELIQFCDMVFASTDAVFFQGEINLGIIPGGGGTQLLPRLIGDKKARELIYTGRRLTAEEAAKLGLVNAVCTPEELEKCVMSVVEEIKQKSPLAVALAKKAINAVYELPLSKGLEYEQLLFQRALVSEDGKEGLRAFLEKRKPVFKGR